MGRNAPGSERPIYSLELCGGTHVSRTGDIGLIKVLSESAIAAGVRRIEALAGEAAKAYLDEQDRRVQQASAILKTAPNSLLERLEALMEERKKLEKDLRDAKKALALGGGGSSAAIEEINGFKFHGRVLPGLAPQDLKPLAQDALKTLGSGVVAMITISDDSKASIVTGVSPDLQARFNAVDLVRLAATTLGGKGGGGKPDFAQAGGPEGSKADAAIAAIKDALSAG
jgi:alanyl-tRNA synthetase